MLTDRRDSRRLEPLAGRDAAKLHHNGRTDVALVLNVSAEGFRICTHAGYVFRIGDEVKFDTCDGRHVGRVVHVSEEQERVFLGLTRIEDTPTSNSGGSLQMTLRRRDKFTDDRIDIGAIVAYVLLPLAIALSILLLVTGQDGLKDISHTIARHIGL
jgi:ABC-type phosphonate transport system ATPase subunit